MRAAAVMNRARRALQYGVVTSKLDGNVCNGISSTPIMTTVNVPIFLRHFSSRPDPFARRPTAKCDPYGQGGKPLTFTEAHGLLATVEPEWKLWKNDDGGDGEEEGECRSVPFALVRDYWHNDYMQGAEFVKHVSAVAQMNDHYPHQVILDRYLSSREKAWKVRTRIICRTFVLQGLSHHDFFLATLLDVETKRPGLANLLA